ncbi:MAG: aminoglycoside phosphotransferase family protein [Bdellovibrionales bacterium]|nr:aminoglycoside phosphotransferase family protein [Bdellovibrionales bacterium]
MKSQILSEEIQFAHWLRQTKKNTWAKVLAFLSRDALPTLYPEIFPIPPEVTAASSQGWTNLCLFIVREDKKAFVLRGRPLGEGEDFRSVAYNKEAFILKTLRGKVPVAEVPEQPVTQGTLEGAPFGSGKQFVFMLQERLDGVPASELNLPFKEREWLLIQLGQTARAIHSINVDSFGPNFCVPKPGTIRERQGDFYNSVLALMRIDWLVSRGALDAVTAGFVRDRVELLKRAALKTDLYHNDFAYNWSNVLIDPSTRRLTGIIDWEFAGVGAAIYQEFSSLVYPAVRDGVSFRKASRALSHFLVGYGMSQEEFEVGHRFHFDTYLLIQAVQALRKYEELRESNQSSCEPWRRLFAVRARNLLDFLCHSPRDRTKIALER